MSIKFISHRIKRKPKIPHNKSGIRFTHDRETVAYTFSKMARFHIGPQHMQHQCKQQVSGHTARSPITVSTYVHVHVPVVFDVEQVLEIVSNRFHRIFITQHVSHLLANHDLQHGRRWYECKRTYVYSYGAITSHWACVHGCICSESRVRAYT